MVSDNGSDGYIFNSPFDTFELIIDVVKTGGSSYTVGTVYFCVKVSDTVYFE